MDISKKIILLIISKKSDFHNFYFFYFISLLWDLMLIYALISTKGEKEMIYDNKGGSSEDYS